MNDSGDTEQRKRAAAISYDKESADAVPKLAAKGEGLVAEKIIAIAEEAGVPITRDPDLYTLLAKLDVGQHIHPDLYEVVAELLVFIYRIKQEYETDQKRDSGGSSRGEDRWESGSH